MNRRSFLKLLSMLTLIGIVKPKGLFGEEFPLSMEYAGSSSKNAMVVRVFNNNACTWDYLSAPYIDYIDYAVVKEMLSRGLMELTGKEDVREAWQQIIKPYRAGDKIVIKPNLNNTKIGYAKAIMTSPQVVTAVVETLIESGFRAGDIIVYDLTARENPEIMAWLKRQPIGVVLGHDISGLIDKAMARLYLSPHDADRNARIDTRSDVRSKDGTQVTCYIPKVVTQASHIINVPVFKAHQFVLQSSSLKNHFGTVRFSNFNSYPIVLHGKGIERNIVDINRQTHIRNKTRIIIADGIVGAPLFYREGYGRVPSPWKTLQTGPTPNSIFLSRDPIALESVVADYIIYEQEKRGFTPYSHDYLHDAMAMGLGIHEHRDGDGRYKLIEYRELPS